MSEDTGIAGLTIGQRIRLARSRQGMSLAKLAELTGLSKGYLSMVENGQRGLDQRRTLHAVADALRVPANRLTGQPYDPRTRQEEIVQAAVADVRGALHGTEFGQRYEEPTRDLTELQRVAEEVTQLSNDNAFANYGPLLPDLLTDLHAHTADPDGAVRQATLPVLVDALDAARRLMICVGEPDLTALAAERAAIVAEASADPALIGVTQWMRAQALLHIDRARKRAAAVATKAAAALQQHAGGGPAAEMYGMLHLSAAWAHTVNGRTGDAEVHIAEATETASRTGDGHAFRLWFGPNNVAVWRMALALERGDVDQVPELARAVNANALPSRARRAEFYIDLGRGLSAHGSSQPHAAEEAFQRAERLAPLRTRMNPFVRAKVRELYHNAASDNLRQMARRMGIAPV
jgi:transcriptional regulator with XRE-family HTH domain